MKINSEHFRQELSPQNTRNGISEHQEFKICRGACPHTLLAAYAFSTRKIHQWLKNIPIFHTQKVGKSSGLVRLLVNLREFLKQHQNQPLIYQWNLYWCSTWSWRSCSQASCRAPVFVDTSKCFCCKSCRWRSADSTSLRILSQCERYELSCAA